MPSPGIEDFCLGDFVETFLLPEIFNVSNNFLFSVDHCVLGVSLAGVESADFDSCLDLDWNVFVFNFFNDL